MRLSSAKSGLVLYVSFGYVMKRFLCGLKMPLTHELSAVLKNRPAPNQRRQRVARRSKAASKEKTRHGHLFLSFVSTYSELFHTYTLF